MKIRCSQAAETQVFGCTYVFEPDDQGRFVAEVDNPRHQAVLLSVDHYSELRDDVREPLPDVTEAEEATDASAGLPPGLAEAPTPIHPLDHDGDGRPGGSRPGRRRR